MPPGPPPGVNFRYEKVPPPKSIADVPRYLKELCAAERLGMDLSKQRRLEICLPGGACFRACESALCA